MGMRLDHARHQRRAAAIDDGDVVTREARGTGADLGDAVAFDEYLAAIRLRSRAVKDRDVRQENR